MWDRERMRVSSPEPTSLYTPPLSNEPFPPADAPPHPPRSPKRAVSSLTTCLLPPVSPTLLFVPQRFAVNPRAFVFQTVAAVSNVFSSLFGTFANIEQLTDANNNNDVAAITAFTRGGVPSLPVTSQPRGPHAC